MNSKFLALFLAAGIGRSVVHIAITRIMHWIRATIQTWARLAVIQSVNQISDATDAAETLWLALVLTVEDGLKSGLREPSAM